MEESQIKPRIFYFNHAVSENTTLLTSGALQHSPPLSAKRKKNSYGYSSQIFQIHQYLSLCLRDFFLDCESTGWLPSPIAGTSQCCYFIFEFVLYGKFRCHLCLQSLLSTIQNACWGLMMPSPVQIHWAQSCCTVVHMLGL